jgi:hypothetical protein
MPINAAIVIHNSFGIASSLEIFATLRRQNFAARIGIELQHSVGDGKTRFGP